MGSDGLCCVFFFFLSESPCCAGRQNLVLPRSALTRSSANSQATFKNSGPAVPAALPAKATRNKREIEGGGDLSVFLFLFFLYLPVSFHHILLPPPLPCVVPTFATSVHRWREAFVANVPPTLHIPRSYRIPHAGGSASLPLPLFLSLSLSLLLSHRWQRSATCVGAGGPRGRVTMWVSVCGGSNMLIHHS